jgi:hypothetical protein
MPIVERSGRNVGTESPGLGTWKDQWKQGEREEYLALKRTAFRGLSDWEKNLEAVGDTE